jgi:hypothetical protein
MDWFYYGVLPIVAGMFLYYIIKGVANQNDKEQTKE